VPIGRPPGRPATSRSTWTLSGCSGLPIAAIVIDLTRRVTPRAQKWRPRATPGGRLRSEPHRVAARLARSAVVCASPSLVGNADH
jgi:hypothetical protein